MEVEPQSVEALVGLACGGRSRIGNHILPGLLPGQLARGLNARYELVGNPLVGGLFGFLSHGCFWWS